MMDELANVLSLLAAALDRLEIPYAVGGSIASSVRGVVRATEDIDVVARLAARQADELASELGPDWYADADQIRSAISAGRAFNLVYLRTLHKVDVFPASGPFHLSQLERATRATVGEQAEFPVASAEDILLAKLQWYRDGGEVSDRQWSDITGIVAVNPGLDRQYLEGWAARLGVSRLLVRALADPGREP